MTPNAPVSNGHLSFTWDWIQKSKLMLNHPKVNEYVGNCGRSGNPHVLEVIFDDMVSVKIHFLFPFRCQVQRDSSGTLQAVKLIEP